MQNINLSAVFNKIYCIKMKKKTSHISILNVQQQQKIIQWNLLRVKKNQVFWEK